MNFRQLNYYDLGDDPIDVLVEWRWEEKDCTEPLRSSSGRVLYMFPPIRAIQQRYTDAMHWCADNCKGKWYHGDDSVSFHFELTEDAALFTMFWGGRRIHDWISRQALLDKNPSRKI